MTTNPTVNLSDKIIDVGFKLLNIAIQAAFPALFKIPVLSYFIKSFLNYFLNGIDDTLKLAIANAIIDQQTSSEAKAAKDARDALQLAIKTGTPDELTKANQDFDSSYADLIRSHGV